MRTSHVVKVMEIFSQVACVGFSQLCFFSLNKSFVKLTKKFVCFACFVVMFLQFVVLI